MCCWTKRTASHDSSHATCAHWACPVIQVCEVGFLTHICCSRACLFTSSCLRVRLFTSLFVNCCLFTSLFVYESLFTSSDCLRVVFFVHDSVCLRVCLFTTSFVCLRVRLFTSSCLRVCLVTSFCLRILCAYQLVILFTSLFVYMVALSVRRLPQMQRNVVLN